jgi:hypothetical protein
MSRGDEGESGGLSNVVSAAEAAPGLKEKSGSGRGDLDWVLLPGSSTPGLNEKSGRAESLLWREGPGNAAASPPKSNDLCGDSTADLGRRPVALESEEGAEDEDGRTGKTKGGFGSGVSMRGDNCESPEATTEEALDSSIALSTEIGTGTLRADLRLVVRGQSRSTDPFATDEESIDALAANAVAIIPQTALRRRPIAVP